jgi:hypothetical protein
MDSGSTARLACSLRFYRRNDEWGGVRGAFVRCSGGDWGVAEAAQLGPLDYGFTSREGADACDRWEWGDPDAMLCRSVAGNFGGAAAP